MADRPVVSAILLTLVFISMLALPAFGQIDQLPPPPLPDPALLADIFHNTKTMQEQARALEFKETVSFRLAGVVPDGRASRNIDFRQSADYAVTVKPGQAPERKFLQSNHRPQFGLANILKDFDVSGIQETMPSIANLEMALLGFVSAEYVNGYKELGREQIKKHHALKLELRFRPGRWPVERCYLWIDEQNHAPLRAELKIGNIGRFYHVALFISYDEAAPNSLPGSIHQEVDCDTYERGVPLRLEHNSVYSEFKSLTAQ